MASSKSVIAIVGAGFSGSLLTLNLLKAGPAALTVVLIEKSAGFGRGLAYGTNNPRHLLNVRVANMSAWPNDADHLLDWLAKEHGEAGQSRPQFISRGEYGRYLASILQDALSGPDGGRRLLLEHDEAVGLERTPGRLRLTLAMGRVIEADTVVLASGHQPSAPPPGVGFEMLSEPLHIRDPWVAGALDAVPRDEPVLLLGSGLTMVDVALSLDTRGHEGPILVLSRRGLAPRRHIGPPKIPMRPAAITDAPLSGRLAALRRRSEEIGWREAVDELRPSVQAIWQGASLAERRRFLRHLRPWWDVHRHRMAPDVARWLDHQRAIGRLTLTAGRITSVEQDRDGVAVVWRRRGSTRSECDHVARIIDCTGPGGERSDIQGALLRRLLNDGAARLDPLGLGLDVDAAGRLLDAQGRADNSLYAVGPLTQSAFWETIAVPDIRNQVADLASRLATQTHGWRSATDRMGVVGASGDGAGRQTPTRLDLRDGSPNNPAVRHD